MEKLEKIRMKQAQRKNPPIPGIKERKKFDFAHMRANKCQDIRKFIQELQPSGSKEAKKSTKKATIKQLLEKDAEQLAKLNLHQNILLANMLLV